MPAVRRSDAALPRSSPPASTPPTTAHPCASLWNPRSPKATPCVGAEPRDGAPKAFRIALDQAPCHKALCTQSQDCVANSDPSAPIGGSTVVRQMRKAVRTAFPAPITACAPSITQQTIAQQKTPSMEDGVFRLVSLALGPVQATSLRLIGAQIRLFVRYSSTVRTVRKITPVRPACLRAIIFGSAAHIRKADTSSDWLSMVLICPSSNSTSSP